MYTLRRPTRMVLQANSAADLMKPNPVSIRADATVREAVAMLTDRGYGIAPVIDEAGRPVGVLSRTDILVHDREQVRHAGLEDITEWESPPRKLRAGFEVEIVDPTLVRDIMTPVVFTVLLDTPAADVIEQMLALKVHHLFVVDEACSLVGIVSALDVIKHLHREEH